MNDRLPFLSVSMACPARLRPAREVFLSESGFSSEVRVLEKVSDGWQLQGSLTLFILLHIESSKEHDSLIPEDAAVGRIWRI